MTDYYLEQLKHRVAEIDADLQQVNAGLAKAKVEGNDYAARELIQSYADIVAQRRNLEVAANEYARSIQPQEVQPLTDAEFMAMSPERMAQLASQGNTEAIDRIFSKSIHYTKDQWSDPEVQRRVRAGVNEVARRRSEGR